MAKRRSTKRPSTETLLKEYEFSQSTAQSMERTIWQSSAIIGIGLMGSFILVASRAEAPWYVGCLIGPIVFVVSGIWWFVARRWWSVQHAMFMRMRHIERKLGIHSLSYIQYLDNPNSIPRTGLTQLEKKDITARADKKVLLGLKDHQRQGVQEIMWPFPFVMLLAWIGFAVFLLADKLF
jgi:hypothetical protein